MKKKPDHSVEILYENDSFLCINKPVGMVANRSDTHKGYTLQDWIEDNVELKKYVNEKEFMNRMGLVHRLDKETSGVILIAKTAEAFKNLQSQFKERTVKKTYLALVFGFIKDIKSGDSFTVNAPIARNPTNRQRFAIVKGGRNAVTDFKIIEKLSCESGDYSLVECFPKSGRTHQIRVHLTALNHPVIGDKLYSGRKRSKKFAKRFKRQYLHAKSIKFKDPVSNKVINIEAPLPEDFNTVLNFLRKRKAKRAG